jgi:hypothetical protein
MFGEHSFLLKELFTGEQAMRQDKPPVGYQR